MRQTISMGWGAGAAALALASLALGGWPAGALTGWDLLWLPRAIQAPAPPVAHGPAPPPAIAPVAPVPAAPVLPPSRPQDAQYAQLRAQLRWIEARIDGRLLATPDLPSRMLLAKSAARQARLHEVGLGFQDVYGLIEAETSWVPRAGASRDGTPNLGVAQFEPATAQALGVRDPHDVVEAVHAAAEHMREAAVWSRGRIAGLKLSRKQHARKLREGVSIYYNLSSKGRAAWSGRNTHRLPLATQRHIRNAREGARDAAVLDARLRAAQPRTATASVARAAPLADGS